jgi:hypothetical protein
MKPSTWAIGLVSLTVLTVLALRRNVHTYAHREPHAEARGSRGSVSSEIVSVSDAAFSNGRWYLTDAKATRVHVLDSTGALLRSFGGRGLGPGELLSPSLIAATKNRVYVAQVTVPDVSVFDADGKFLQLLHAEKPCGASGILALATGGDDLFVLRRCLEMPRGFRLQVERAQGDRLVVWPAIADTIRASSRGLLPLTVPILAADEERVVFSAGSTPCLRLFRRVDGSEESARCLTEIPRVATSAEERASLQKNSRNRIEVPDSLPPIRRALLLDARLIVQAIDGSDSMTWIELPWRPVPGNTGRVLGRPHTRESYLGSRAHLIVTDDVEGVRIETVKVER